MLSATGCALWRGERSLGGEPDDAAITATIEARIAEDEAARGAAIRVDTRDGNVTLSGTAASALAKQTAEGIAIKVPGTKTVRNDVAVAR